MTVVPHVLVIGGGPGGATTAAILAKEGVRVTLVERQRFPREHVGESLQPAAITLLDRHLGLAADIAACGFPRKYGAQYVWGESREPWSVLFDERLEQAVLAGELDEAGLAAGNYEHAYNVDRAVFDDIVLKAALGQGAELVEADARAPILDGERVVGARVQAADGGERELRADFVVDASGQRCLLGRALGLAEDVADMRATATYTYVDGAGGVAGPLGRSLQLVVSLSDGWAWFIPVAADRTSIGIVSQRRERLSETRFDELLAEAALPIEGARFVPDAAGKRLRFGRDWSYACRRVVGDGFALVGDAACFVDPILSGGVDFAVRMGCRVALALLRGFAGDADLDQLLAAYQQQLRREYRAYLRLARYWYGNNRSVQGLFWQAHREIPKDSVSTPLRAFVYLTTGNLAADQHLRVFQQWQEEKMFRALGVDQPALRRAWKSRQA